MSGEPVEGIGAKLSWKPLLQDKDGGCYVPVSHRELGELIGRLMQMLEMNGDIEQRNAQKQETKWRCREWLDELYSQSGYDKFEGARTSARIFKMN